MIPTTPSIIRIDWQLPNASFLPFGTFTVDPKTPRIHSLIDPNNPSPPPPPTLSAADARELNALCGPGSPFAFGTRRQFANIGETHFYLTAVAVEHGVIRLVHEAPEGFNLDQVAPLPLSEARL